MRLLVAAPGGLKGLLLRRIVRDTVRCAGCGRRFRLARMRFLARRDGIWVYLAYCPGCGSLSVIGVAVQDGGPLLTDITPREVRRFADAPAVSVDDVLDMHLFLAHFDGDLASLRNRPRRTAGQAEAPKEKGDDGGRVL